MRTFLWVAAGALTTVLVFVVAVDRWAAWYARSGS